MQTLDAVIWAVGMIAGVVIFCIYWRKKNDHNR